MLRGCISFCEVGACSCPSILTTNSKGQPVVRAVDGFVHVHFGAREYVMSAALAEEFVIALNSGAKCARRTAR